MIMWISSYCNLEITPPPPDASVRVGVVEKVRFYPQTPQGGLYNLLDFKKSPLGVPIAIGIGV